MVLTAAVAGASGYAGGELLRILAGHPQISVKTLAAHSNAGQKVVAVQPHLVSYAEETFVDTTAENLAGHDVVFLALPHGASGPLAAEIAARSPNTLLIDCGADHRLESNEAWDSFYGGPFNEPWTYGVPELLVADGKQREHLKGTHRIAAPGCNASTVSLALAPGVAAGVLDASDIVATLAVGPSGAGKALRTNLLASEIMGSATPYAVGGAHRHIPEIRESLQRAADDPNLDVNLTFTPVLVPMPRGILAVCSAPIRGVESEDALRKPWEAAYAEEEFVRLLPSGLHPATAATVGANTVLMSVTLDADSGRATIIAAVDNLAKGTAGAAIQSANIALGLPETMGLTANGVAP